MILTIRETLHKCVRSALDLADCLIIKDDHLTPNGD